MTSFKVTAKLRELSAKDFRSLLGFRDAKEGEEGIRYTRKDGTKGRFVLDRNRDNRPLKMGRVEQLSEQIFQGIFAGQWNHPSETCNGETIILDSTGQVTSGAHRGLATIFAQDRRDLLAAMGQTELIEEYNVPETISLPTILVEGIDPAAADTVDLVVPRQMGDVLYRRHAVGGKELSATQRATLNRELAVALRLVWLRLRGEQVSGGGKFNFPEALRFLEGHPLLVDCLNHVFAENDNSRISGLISLGYAAGLMYLAAFSGEDREVYEKGSLNTTKKPTKWEDAEKFWTLFGQMSARTLKKDENETIHAIVSVLDSNKKSSDKYSRDAICSLICRAWNAFSGGEGGKTPGALTKGLFKKVKTGDTEREVLILDRFGGLDLDKDTLKASGWIKEEVEVRRVKAEGFKVGDKVWVDQPNLEPWFGTLKEFAADGKTAVVAVHESDRKDGEPEEYGCEMEWIKADRPERANVELVKEESTKKSSKTPPKTATKKVPPPKKG